VWAVGAALQLSREGLESVGIHDLTVQAEDWRGVGEGWDGA